jgi:hypothetical protein
MMEVSVLLKMQQINLSRIVCNITSRVYILEGLSIGLLYKRDEAVPDRNTEQQGA